MASRTSAHAKQLWHQTVPLLSLHCTRSFKQQTLLSHLQYGFKQLEYSFKQQSLLLHMEYSFYNMYRKYVSAHMVVDLQLDNN